MITGPAGGPIPPRMLHQKAAAAEQRPASPTATAKPKMRPTQRNAVRDPGPTQQQQQPKPFAPWDWDPPCSQTSPHPLNPNSVLPLSLNPTRPFLSLNPTPPPLCHYCPRSHPLSSSPRPPSWYMGSSFSLPHPVLPPPPPPLPSSCRARAREPSSASHVHTPPAIRASPSPHRDFSTPRFAIPEPPGHNRLGRRSRGGEVLLCQLHPCACE
jgi:hypothetical protein